MNSSGIYRAQLFALGQLNRIGDSVSRASERLSSGLRINRVSDDPAAAMMAELTQNQSKVIFQAQRNVQDGTSMVNAGRAALDELMNIAVRIKELAGQAANGAMTDTQRDIVNTEAALLTDEYNRIVQSTTFNNQRFFETEQTSLQIQAGPAIDDSIAIQFGTGLLQDGAPAVSTVGEGTYAGGV